MVTIFEDNLNGNRGYGDRNISTKSYRGDYIDVKQYNPKDLDMHSQWNVCVVCKEWEFLPEHYENGNCSRSLD